MADSNNWSMRVGSAMNRVWKHPAGYLEGCVITPQGIVAVYSQGGKNEVPSTSIEIVVDGRLHRRTINKRFTQRGLVTLAGRFAREVSHG